MKMSFLFSFCFLATIGYVFGECSSGCKEPTLFYDELNCKPVFASSDDCCPAKYDCSHIEARAAAKEEVCHFDGRTYKLGDEVANHEVDGNCQGACRCNKKHSGHMGFTCTLAIDCPDMPHPGCHYRIELNQCCSGEEVCPPFKVTCKVNGETYHEGNSFSAPNKKCIDCVCKKGFNGEFEAPFCQQRKCVEEVIRQVEVNNFCAPTFISLEDCCPYNWKCPEKEDQIVAASTPSELKCKYGEQSLNIGDKFERTSGTKGKLSCECRIPPYLTCIENYDYPSFAPAD